MTYKDMTFCPFWKDCAKGRECFRALTDKVNRGAEELALPICQFSKEPSCFEETL